MVAPYLSVSAGFDPFVGSVPGATSVTTQVYDTRGRVTCTVKGGDGRCLGEVGRLRRCSAVLSPSFSFFLYFF